MLLRKRSNFLEVENVTANVLLATLFSTEQEFVRVKESPACVEEEFMRATSLYMNLQNKVNSLLHIVELLQSHQDRQ